MIRQITNLSQSRYQCGTFTEFMIWFRDQQQYQIDIETDITDWWYDKKLISIQFGSATLREKNQWFIQWSALTPEQQQELKDELNNDFRVKLAHTGKFEYIVLSFYGIILENLYDTMLAEKVIRGGMENDDYALADISWKYLHIIMDKSLQMSFGDNIITDEKILYGITDVAHLDVIQRFQFEELTNLGLVNVAGLEMDVLPAFCDITREGMILDKEKWRENIRLAEPIVEQAKNTLNKWLFTHPFQSFATDKGYISDKDRVTINFKSHQQKSELLKLVFPDIIGATALIIKKYIRDNNLSISQLTILTELQEKKYDSLCDVLVNNHYDYLVKNNYLIPANEITINWNSRDQVLPLVQLVEPKLKDLSEESRNKTTHKMLKDLEKYKSALKLINDLGESFIHDHCSPDGKVRGNFNQIISTGRCSSSKPNMQNIIAGNKAITDFDPNGLRYRNAFTCEPGWSFVDGDYISQELVIIAYLSKDPVWMECIEKGWDLHSVCSELVYGKRWKDAAQSDCEYYRIVVGPDGKLTQSKQKCNCKQHKILRYDCKTINFGLCYGMTEFKLSGELNISLKEAKALIQQYFVVFPSIGAVLDFMGRFGVLNGYIMTLAPFNRKRFFPYWREFSGYIQPYLAGSINISNLGEIERASKNHPIQGTSADIVKVAMWHIRDYIRKNKLRDKVKLQANVHDQITTIARDDFKDEWKSILNRLMWEAGNLIIPTGILQAEVQITSTWSK